MRFIFNPTSGGARRNARLLPRLRGFIAARGLDADLTATDGPGHATVLAHEAVRAGCQRGVAVGGDGTMNEVAQVLRDGPTALALVPAGSGNGLARHLRLPKTMGAALELAADPAARIAQIDAGTVGGRPFFNVMGSGLDAEVSGRFNRLRRRGLSSYLRASVSAFIHRRAERCAITGPEGRETLEALLIAVANSDQYGNGARIAPGARADDGLLDLIAVRPVGPAGAALLAIRLFLGTFDRSPRVRRLRGSHFRIERPTASPIHTDGEVHRAPADLDLAVQAGSLRVIAP